MSLLVLISLQCLAEVAKQRHGRSLEKALADCHISDHDDGNSELYKTRVFTDSDGRLVKETAV